MGGVVTYLPMALSSLGMVLVFLRPGEGNGVLMWVAVGMMTLSAVVMLVAQFFRAAGNASGPCAANAATTSGTSRPVGAASAPSSTSSAGPRHGTIRSRTRCGR